MEPFLHVCDNAYVLSYLKLKTFFLCADGQTSSGKTHTMLGSEGVKGLLELSAADLFNHMACMDDRDFIVRVSFVEIYNEV
jgi:hypothetical protein